jgi:transposase
MSRYRLEPSPAQEAVLRRHCPDAEGSVTVQQQAIRDFDQAMRNFFAGTHHLKIKNMTRSARGTIEAPGQNVRAKAGLNRSISQQGWGMFARYLEYKAPGRVEKIDPAYTSQRCPECGHVDADSRKSQALFACTACGYSCNADVNAARNIAAGHAVRGDQALARSLNREPQSALLVA